MSYRAASVPRHMVSSPPRSVRWASTVRTAPRRHVLSRAQSERTVTRRGLSRWMSVASVRQAGTVRPRTSLNRPGSALPASTAHWLPPHPRPWIPALRVATSVPTARTAWKASPIQYRAHRVLTATERHFHRWEIVQFVRVGSTAHSRVWQLRTETVCLVSTVSTDQNLTLRWVRATVTSVLSVITVPNTVIGQ